MSALIGLLLASAILLVVAGLGLYNLSRCRTELAQLQARHADELARFRTELVQLQARHAEWTAAEAHLELLRKEALQVREGIQSAIRANHENEKKRRASFDAEEASKKLDLDLKRLKLENEHQQALRTFQRLRSEISSLESSAEDLSFGLYEPHFTFADPEEYRDEMKKRRSFQKELVRTGKATQCAINWTVGESRREGERLIRSHTKLALRAFNGECEAALADVNWSNIVRMEDRINAAREAINNLGSVLNITITSVYAAAKLEELWLKYDLEQRRHKDREEQRRIREQIREEERVRKEIEEALIEAETEEEGLQKAIAKAHSDFEHSAGTKLQEIALKIASFEAKLDEARAKKERAVSRAQLTKSGFVYVISNIGSFGENVFKIGMTRRLEPMDRVYELSGAAVPFPFDLHAMLYSDDAPALEASLHQLLSCKRLNLVNGRREFFKNVELSEIRSYIEQQGLSAQFIERAEAREFRETLARLIPTQTVLAGPSAERQEEMPSITGGAY